MRLVKPRLVVGIIIVSIFVILGFVVPWFAPENPTDWNTYFRNLDPSAQHIMGTNNLGQDIFWLLSWSIRNSLWIGLSVAALATIIGVIVGLLAGFLGGFSDRTATLIMDIVIAVPSLPILILISALLGGKQSLLIIAGVLVICAALVLTGLMIQRHRQVSAQLAHRAEFVTAAKESVVALLSIDFNHAKADVQKVIDLSTGTFRDDFTKGAQDFVTTAEKSKAVTVGKVNAAALESENGDTGVVLLAATSQVTNANGARQDPRAWRMSVTMTRDGDKLKMSNVEFVP